MACGFYSNGGKKQRSSSLKPSASYVKAVDKQAMWKPRDQVANMLQAIALASEEHGDSEGLRPGGVESDKIQDQVLNSQVSSLLRVEKFKQLAVLMHQSQGPVNDRKKVMAIPRNKEPQSRKSMSDDEDSLKGMGVSGRKPASDLGKKQHDSPKPPPVNNVERPHSGDSATREKDHYKVMGMSGRKPASDLGMILQNHHQLIMWRDLIDLSCRVQTKFLPERKSHGHH